MSADISTSEALRRAYARNVVATARASGDERLEQAFASVPRERHLGPGPWLTSGLFGALGTTGDLARIYRDELIALDAARGINTGEPSLHARWLHAARVQPGERVVHIGAGAGYYSAVLAELVGPAGDVVALEYDATLAARARAALADTPQVALIHGDGARWPRRETDLVYVNFAVERPAAAWIDALAPGGRLIFPLAAPDRGGSGIGFLVERRGATFAARALDHVRFIRAQGGEGEFSEPGDRPALARAFAAGGVERVRSLIWRGPADPARSWFVGRGWALSFDPP